VSEAGSDRLRVLVVGHWDEGSGYPRAETLLTGLRLAGHDVHECRAAQPRRRCTKTELVARPWLWPGYWLATRRARRDLQRLFVHRRAEVRPDVILVPYPGHLAVRWIRRWWDGPIVLDLFLSAWSTVIEDRKLFGPGSPVAHYLAALDRRACEAADIVLMDTAQHASIVQGLTGLDTGRFDWVPVADPARVHATPLPDRLPGEPLRVLFFGTGVPLHGLDEIVSAVERVPGVHLTLIGGHEEGRRLAARRLSGRLDLRGRFVPLGDVRRAIDASHLVLGVFGTSRKAHAVVPFKLVHALNHARPVLTGDTPAVRGLLSPGHDCLVVPPGDIGALAGELDRLVSDSSCLAEIAMAGRRTAETTFSVGAAGRRLGAALGRAARGRQPVPAMPVAAQAG
jgi:glycosyltransferase involved in cell wall biosynthesis